MNKVLKELLSTGLYILFVLCCTYLLVTYVVQRTEVDGTSMVNTLQDRDNLFVDKISYRFKEPERFDIIVFPPEHDPGKYYIKRIIGLPGETVWIDYNGDIYIDGAILEENYGYEVIDQNHIGNASIPITLGSDEYFVMGDNRNNSLDSRSPIVGNIKRSQLIGKAWIRIWPLSNFGKIDK